MAELVQNRSQRLHFDVSSPNGILLFRVTSQMIVAYGMANSKTFCYERRVDNGDYRKRPVITLPPPPPSQLQAYLPENKKNTSGYKPPGYKPPPNYNPPSYGPIYL